MVRTEPTLQCIKLHHYRHLQIIIKPTWFIRKLTTRCYMLLGGGRGTKRIMQRRLCLVNCLNKHINKNHNTALVTVIGQTFIQVGLPMKMCDCDPLCDKLHIRDDVRCYRVPTKTGVMKQLSDDYVLSLILPLSLTQLSVFIIQHPPITLCIWIWSSFALWFDLEKVTRSKTTTEILVDNDNHSKWIPPRTAAFYLFTLSVLCLPS